MAIQPTQPQDNGRLGKLLTVGGAVAGGIFGGVPGAAAGAGLGQTVGGLAQKQPNQPIQSESEGMQRRMSSFQQDPMRRIQEAQAAAAQLPADQFPEVRRAFENAMAIARQNQQFGRT